MQYDRWSSENKIETGRRLSHEDTETYQGKSREENEPINGKACWLSPDDEKEMWNQGSLRGIPKRTFSFRNHGRIMFCYF